MFSEYLRMSLEASFYPVRPIGFEDLGFHILSVIQRLFSLLLLALLALALRQQVNRRIGLLRGLVLEDRRTIAPGALLALRPPTGGVNTAVRFSLVW